MFDKDCYNISLESFSETIKTLSTTSGLSSSLILIDDNEEESEYVDATVTNTVNKESLRALFEKLI
jgi:hypothetical protein